MCIFLRICECVREQQLLFEEIIFVNSDSFYKPASHFICLHDRVFASFLVSVRLHHSEQLSFCERIRLLLSHWRWLWELKLLLQRNSKHERLFFLIK